LQTGLTLSGRLPYNNMRDKPMNIYTTEEYWDCECQDSEPYIHPKSENTCLKCGSYSEDQPDSRVGEVLKHLQFSGTREDYYRFRNTLRYNNELDAERQLEVEESIAELLFYDYKVGEQEANDLGKRILKEILFEFRPDLFEVKS
jgi:hypothetical protein